MEGGFGDFYGQTSLHPLALAGVVAMALLVFALRREHVLLPLIAAATTLPMAQRIIVAGGDFTLMRILLLACVTRIFMRGETAGFRWNRLDTAVLLWTVAGTLVTTLHYGTMGVFINRMGWSFDILVTYFTVRWLVRDIDDILVISKFLAVTAVPIAAFFFVEHTTHRNLFSVFGGVPAETVMREGKFRCQGPFAHPILAGTFWASALPMIWMLWKQNPAARLWCVLGTLAIGVIIFACSSSTPMLSAMVAAAGLAVFGYRHIRKRIWVSVLVSLAVLQLFMDRPVWHLFARVDLVGGSTGWHRFIILETFFEHFDKWWVSGESDATSWGVWQMRDITNQFILEGLRGGLLTLLCFTAVVIYAFGNVGRSLTAMAPLKNEFAERVAWLVGVTIFLHTVTFFGVSYFGQMTAILYMHIALCGALAAQIVPNLLAGNAPVPEVPETPRSRRARIAAGAARRRQTSAGLPK